MKHEACGDPQQRYLTLCSDALFVLMLSAFGPRSPGQSPPVAAGGLDARISAARTADREAAKSRLGTVKFHREVVWRLCGRRVVSIVRDLPFVCLSPLLRQSEATRQPVSADSWAALTVLAARALRSLLCLRDRVNPGPVAVWRSSQTAQPLRPVPVRVVL